MKRAGVGASGDARPVPRLAERLAAAARGQVCGLLIASLFAGQHTSSITSAWTGLHLVASPAWLAKCVAEQTEVLAKSGPALDYDILQSMDTLHVCIKEARVPPCCSNLPPPCSTPPCPQRSATHRSVCGCAARGGGPHAAAPHAR